MSSDVFVGHTLSTTGRDIQIDRFGYFLPYPFFHINRVALSGTVNQHNVADL